MIVCFKLVSRSRWAAKSIMIDLNGSVVPGQGAAGLHLGAPLATVLAELGVPVRRRRGLFKYELPPLKIWSLDGLIQQILVEDPYQGRLPHGIGIRSTIAEVEQSIGHVVEDAEDNLVTPTLPGWGFETELWSGHDLARNKSARITAIYVFWDQALREL